MKPRPTARKPLVHPAAHLAIDVCLSLFLGVLITYLVAWYHALWSPIRLRAQTGLGLVNHRSRVDISDFFTTGTGPNVVRTISPVPACWRAFLNDGDNSSSGCVSRASTARLDEFIVFTKSAADRSLPSGTLLRFESGWPQPALCASSGTPATGWFPFAVTPRWEHGVNAHAMLRPASIPAGVATGISRPLPLMPLWPGFVVNTAIFSLVPFTLFGVPKRVRWYKRSKRGQCLACGYPRNGLPPEAPCPECGAAPNGK